MIYGPGWDLFRFTIKGLPAHIRVVFEHIGSFVISCENALQKSSLFISNSKFKISS